MDIMREIAEKVRKELINKEKFSIDDFYEIVGYSAFSFHDFCEYIKVEEIPQYEVKEISLEQLCENASIEGGEEKGIEEVGAPFGTTFIIRNLFYNTPARRKFLKSKTTEASYIAAIVEKIALSNPGISIRFIVNSNSKLHTSGNGRLKDINKED